MAVVLVIAVRHRVVTTARAVDMHMARVWLVDRLELGDDLVHVIGLEVVEMPVVEVVEVVAVRDGRVPAPRVVGVVVIVVRRVGDGRWVHRTRMVAHPRADAPDAPDARAA